MTEQKHLPALRREERIAQFVGGKFTPEQIAVIRKTVAGQSRPDLELTDAELCVYLAQAARTGLDPFSRQIYAIKRWSKGGPKLTIQTSIDGFRSIAERTKQFGGSDDYVYQVDERTGKPVSATCTVYRLVGGQRIPFATRTARWSEFYPGEKGGQMWDRMPFHMLGKCAEALALRAAFPADLSGLYTDDEMAQAERVEATEAAYTVRPEQAGDAEMAAVEAQAALEGREVELDEPEWSVEAPAGEQGGGA